MFWMDAICQMIEKEVQCRGVEQGCERCCSTKHPIFMGTVSCLAQGADNPCCAPARLVEVQGQSPSHNLTLGTVPEAV